MKKIAVVFLLVFVTALAAQAKVLKYVYHRTSSYDGTKHWVEENMKGYSHYFQAKYDNGTTVYERCDANGKTYGTVTLKKGEEGTYEGTEMQWGGFLTGNTELTYHISPDESILLVVNDFDVDCYYLAN